MQSELEPPSPNRRPVGGVDRPASDKAEKPLGRGLEEISQLFLSRRANGTARQETTPTPPPAITGSVLLRSRNELSHDQLTNALQKFVCALGDMKPIDSRIQCDPYGEIDVIAVDRNGQLTIVDCDTVADDGLLTRGLAHADWVARNVGILRRLYGTDGINFLKPPRLCLVAVYFSPVLQAAARRLTQPRVACVRCHTADVFGGTGMLFEPLEE
jgi:hypothetical protein